MDKVEELLNRGVEKVYPSKEELKKAITERKLRVYQGFDATSPDLHIGHMVGLRKLKQWQELGHTVIFLIGDFTSTIGDPSGKDSARVPLTHDAVLQNAKTYKEQASKILKFEGSNPAQLKFNSEWLGKMSAADFMSLAKNVTYGQVVERDMFQKRIKRGSDVYMNEFLYPIMQAYDSVEMDIDLEVGGEDQTFNMLMGRKLMRAIKQKEKFVMTTPLLTDSQGQKIGKTEGNAITLNEKPTTLFAKVMALPDDIITKAFEYLTDIEMNEINQIGQHIKKGENPVGHKKRLAFEVVKQLSSHDEAHAAQKQFESGNFSEEESTSLSNENAQNMTASEILTSIGLASSISDAKRLIEQGGVEVDGKKIDDPKTMLFKTPSQKVFVIKKGRSIKKLKIN